MAPLRKPAVFLALTPIALAVLGLGLEPLLVRAWGSHAPAWSHWWCSAASLHSASHTTGSGVLGAALLTSTQALAVHWPHFLPILLGSGTLVYLWRADAGHRTRGCAAKAAGSPTTSS